MKEIHGYHSQFNLRTVEEEKILDMIGR